MNLVTRSSWRPSPTDLLVGVGTAGALLLLTHVATEEGSAPPDALAFLLAALVGLALLWRRRYPTGVAIVSFLLVVGYHALGYPALGNLPLAVALLSASYYSATIPAIAVASVSIVGTLSWFVLGESRELSEAINFVIRESAILAAAILIGYVYRSRRRLADESRERLRLARADQEAQAARRIAEERMTIAREIHDVVAHTVALIGVQTKVAMESLYDSPDDTEQALRIIDRSTRDATSELRATVDVLRSQPSLSPVPRLDQIGSLVDSVSTGDLQVRLVESGHRRELSSLVELVAYRVVQEALTNVVKHAQATRGVVEVAFEESELVVTVSDDGIGGETTPGYGIAGMRERVEAVGGRLSTGPSEVGGLSVMARIPIDRSR